MLHIQTNMFKKKRVFFAELSPLKLTPQKFEPWIIMSIECILIDYGFKGHPLRKG